MDQLRRLKKRGNVEEPSKDKNGRDDNKRNRTGNDFTTTANPVGRENMEEFCPSHEMQNLETELWNHDMVKASHVAYTNRFHELARLVPHLVTPEGRMIERYVYGLASQIREMVAATEPKTMQKAV
nr:reverse transcriptase domain-containing protein [Tanacetum cinerariifolium]